MKIDIFSDKSVKYELNSLYIEKFLYFCKKSNYGENKEIRIKGWLTRR